MRSDLSQHVQPRLTEKRTSGGMHTLERLRQLTVKLLGKLPLLGLGRYPPMPTTERLARLAAHNEKVEHLAQEIIKYRVQRPSPFGETAPVSLVIIPAHDDREFVMPEPEQNNPTANESKDVWSGGK